MFTEDATYVNFLGQVARGRRAIIADHRWLFGKMPGSKMTDGVKTHLHIAFLGPDVAVVTGTGGGTTRPGRESTEDRASTVSFVVHRGAGGWRFAHFQNTRVQPLPAG